MGSIFNNLIAHIIRCFRVTRIEDNHSATSYPPSQPDCSAAVLKGKTSNYQTVSTTKYHGGYNRFKTSVKLGSALISTVKWV